ncbi:MAG: ribokinase [Candidatus Gottesmanbacteria bacterium]|nr:ribokinase [Candidatus Gottesmanbacteria bacterium]
MKIFFTSPYDGKKIYQPYIDRIVKTIESTGATVISPEKSRQYFDSFRDENLKKLGDHDRVHYEFVRQGIANADAVIIEASFENFQVGHEATLAIIYNKPVLCLSQKKDYGELIRHEAFQGERYTDRNLESLVLTFLRKVSQKIRSKRNSSLTTQKKSPVNLSSTHKNIAVLGSINIDMFTKVPFIPKENDVVISTGLKLIPGGKASNAAVGLQRLGEQAYMLGKIGNDTFGESIISLFKNEGINTDFIDTDSFIPTGTVMVNVDARAKNTIIVNEDANTRVNKKTITDFLSAIDKKIFSIDCFYTTLELIPEIISYAIKEFHARGIRIFCDAAPYIRNMSESLYPMIDILSANEFEATGMTGITVTNEKSAGESAKKLRSKGANTIIITLGHLGSVLLEKGQTDPIYFPGIKVSAVDETAAGDAFRAAFVAEFLATKDLKRAMELGNRAGAYAVTRLGSFEALPTREELEFFHH